MEGQAYESVNRAFKSTCKVLFGDEVGEMKGYEKYLLGHQYLNPSRKVSISGKQVVIGADRYGKGASFISQGEIDYSKKSVPLSINDIKDIDSITRAFGERFCYAGSKIFGETKEVEGVDNCTDAFYIYNSHTIVSSKYVGYSSFIREDSEYVFGSSVLIRGHHLLKILGADNLTRSFECNITTNSSDMFFCHNCTSCEDVMFSFNLISKKRAIGNRELERSKYAALKESLVEQSREYLRAHKTFYSLYDFAPPEKALIAGIKVPKIKPKITDMAPIDAAFAATSKLIFGVELSPVKKFEKFLSRNVEKIIPVGTPFGNATCRSNYFWSSFLPEKRMVSEEEAILLGEQKIKIGEGEALSISSLLEKLAGIAFFSVGLWRGNSSNSIETPVTYFSTDCFRVSDATYAKKCAYSIHPQFSEHLFGCGILMVNSSFCIRCHDCVNTSASLDLDSCKNCFRSMFCHNCENLQDCMFCFNAKNLKYAVGNVEVGREKYLLLRGKVIAELLLRLEKQGDFGFDICSLAEYGKKKK